jgi:toxin-antitoxin system PIN domain toxin
VVIVDANILLYAYNEDAASHAAARRWLSEQLVGKEGLALSWHIVTAFLRISTHSKIFPVPLDLDEALTVVTDWLGSPKVHILSPTQRHWQILRGVLISGQARGPLVMDADIAALAIEHDATIATADKDFSRFDGVKVIYPLR